MVAEIFDTIGDVISAMIENLTTALTGVTALFWDTTNSKLTILGILSVIAVGTGLVFFVFNLIRSLIQRGASKG